MVSRFLIYLIDNEGFEKIYQADGTKCSRTALIKTSAERCALKIFSETRLARAVQSITITIDFIKRVLINL